MESNSVPTSSQCGGDDSNRTSDDSIFDPHQLRQQSIQAQEDAIGHSILQQENGKSGDADGGGDWQEEVYQRIKTMNETYLPELNEMYQKIATKLHQYESLPQQPKLDQREKLKMFKRMLERIVPFLQVSKIKILPGYKEKLGLYEKQIIHILATTARPKEPTAASLLQEQLPQSHMQAMPQQQSQISQIMTMKTEPQDPFCSMLKSLHNVNIDWRSQLQAGCRQGIVNKIMETMKIHHPFCSQEEVKKIAMRFEEKQYSAASSQSDYLRTISLKMLTNERYHTPTRFPNPLSSNSNGGDWKEEFYQEIKTMRETYLPELNQMHQEIVTKLQQLDSLHQQQPMSDDVDKLEIFKTMLENFVSVLEVSKTSILPSHKEWKLGPCEWQMIHLLAIRPDPLANSQILELFSLHGPRLSSSAKRSREQQELVEEVKKQKVAIQKLKQTIVELRKSSSNK